MANFIDLYINADTLANATAVFTDVEMTTLATPGYYSDGVTTRYQSATSLGSAVACPDCPVGCENDVIFAMPDSVSGQLSGEVTTGTAAGAIKIEINGVSSNPIGVDIIFNSAHYNTFSSNLATNYTSAIAAPNANIKSYFWAASGGTTGCSNWASGNTNFPIYHYNPTLSTWYNSGTTTSITTTNKLATSLAAGMAGKLITYVPKATAGAQSLLIDFDVVCGTSKTGPSLSVGCPTTLKNISTSAQTTNPVNACSQTSLGSTAYIGPVASTTDNVLAIKDWVFSDANGATKLTNGYYKAAGANLNGVSAANGYFLVINGIVTQIQAC